MMSDLFDKMFDEPQRKARMLDALNALAEQGAFAEIEDPVEWQREQRKERELPGRELD